MMLVSGKEEPVEFDLMAPTLIAAWEAESLYVFWINFGKKVARPCNRGAGEADSRRDRPS